MERDRRFCVEVTAVSAAHRSLRQLIRQRVRWTALTVGSVLALALPGIAAAGCSSERDICRSDCASSPIVGSGGVVGGMALGSCHTECETKYRQCVAHPETAADRAARERADAAYLARMRAEDRQRSAGLDQWRSQESSLAGQYARAAAYCQCALDDVDKAQIAQEYNDEQRVRRCGPGDRFKPGDELVVLLDIIRRKEADTYSYDGVYHAGDHVKFLAAVGEYVIVQAPNLPSDGPHPYYYVPAGVLGYPGEPLPPCARG
jgi:hypothetical protein